MVVSDYVRRIYRATYQEFRIGQVIRNVKYAYDLGLTAKE